MLGTTTAALFGAIAIAAPSPRPHIVTAPACPSDPQFTACIDGPPWSETIWIPPSTPDTWERRVAFKQHEFGHAQDWRMMDDDERSQYANLTHAAEFDDQAFASHYADCRLEPRPRWSTGVSYKLCTFMAAWLRTPAPAWQRTPPAAPASTSPTR